MQGRDAHRTPDAYRTSLGSRQSKQGSRSLHAAGSLLRPPPNNYPPAGAVPSVRSRSEFPDAGTPLTVHVSAVEVCEHAGTDITSKTYIIFWKCTQPVSECLAFELSLVS